MTEPRLAQLEESLRAQVATEPTFKSVQAVAALGVANIGDDDWPAAALSIISAKTISKRAIAGAIYITKRILFGVMVGTRLPSSLGESRLTDGGIYDLYDKLQAKLLGFAPDVGDPSIVAVFPCYEEDFFIDRLEAGSVDLWVLYSVDIELQNPFLPS